MSATTTRTLPGVQRSRSATSTKLRPPKRRGVSGRSVEANRPKPSATPKKTAQPAKPEAVRRKSVKAGRTEISSFDAAKLAPADLKLSMLAIQHEFINLSELKFCFGLQAKAREKGEGTPSLSEVLLHQRYLATQDLEYLEMVRTPDSQVPSFNDIEKKFLENVARIAPGAEFGNYEITEEIGRGGMGVVFKANDIEADRPVALKVLIGREQSSVRDIERFKKEATVMAPLEHDNIVKIADVGREKGLDYIAMTYVDGESLKNLVNDEGPMTSTKALEIISQAAEAMSFIHSHGILHRDIKPDNLMLDDDGRAYLMDFGLAGWDKIEIMQGRGAIGTPMYQPPEQTDVGGPFGPISPCSDVYGLGATLYFLVTGHHPFRGKTVPEIREKIRHEPVIKPREINPQVSPTAEKIILKCLEKKQEDRFASTKELAATINRYLERKNSARESGTPTGTARRLASGNVVTARNTPAPSKTPALEAPEVGRKSGTRRSLPRNPNRQAASPVRRTAPASSASPNSTVLLVVLCLAVLAAVAAALYVASA